MRKGTSAVVSESGSIEAGEPKSWFSIAELADLDLPGLSGVRRVVARRAEEQNWDSRHDTTGQLLARKRSGRGGGTEYHVSLLPPEATLELIRRGLVAAAPQAEPDLHIVEIPAPVALSPWAWFEAQPESTKSDARQKLATIQAVEKLKAGGASATQAVAMVAARAGVSQSALWGWFKLVRGLKTTDWLPALAPRWKGGGVEAEIDPAIWQAYKSDYLRRSEPCHAECYRRIEELARLRGIALPGVVTFKRKLEREVPPEVIISMRKGIAAAVDATVPAQRRTRKRLFALDGINIDGHKWDVRVKFPTALGEKEIITRPMMVMMQDLYSNKILAWRIGRSENTRLTQMAFYDVFDRYGVPNKCLLDNGRAFASNAISGGAKTRFRNKIRVDDPLGLLASLGIGIHWAMPGRGQSKPIERAFRDLEEIIARHPACEGAYTGNHVDNKPENYGTASIDLDVFEALVAKGIEAYNSRTGRRTENAKGGSFDAVFTASYERSIIGKATEECRRLAMLTAEQVRVNRKAGTIDFFENRYWSTALLDMAGEVVTVRFDPDNLHKPLHVYRITGEYLCEAAVIEDAGFFDVEAAKTQAKLRGDMRRYLRRAEEIQDIISAKDLAKLYAEIPADDADPPQVAKITRPVRHRGQTAGALKLQPNAAPAANDQAFLDQIGAAVSALRPASEPSERPVLTLVEGGLSGK